MLSCLRKIPRATLMGLLNSTLLCSAAAANATEVGTNPFVVTVYSEGLGVEQLLTGHYEAALTQMGKPQGWDEGSPLEAATNLCVAQMMTGRFDVARATCDTAVKNARSAAVNASTWGPAAGAAHHGQDVAIAYANRAVLHWLTDDTRRAADDLAQAKRLAPQADFVARNLTALNAKDRTLAQLEPTP